MATDQPRWARPYVCHVPAMRGNGGRVNDDKKAAMAEGRRAGRTVQEYLVALEAVSTRPRGRPRSRERAVARLEQIDQELTEASGVQRLQLTQERRDLAAFLDQEGAADVLAILEARFVKVAAAYGERKGISYAAWREVGVPASVLRAAGITRGKGVVPHA
jgi:hypothetical protein